MRRKRRVGAVAMAIVAGLSVATATTRAGEGDCLRHECSNDVSSQPRFGDEVLAWDPISGWSTRDCPDTASECVTAENRRCYQVAWDDTHEVVFEGCDSATRGIEGTWRYVPADTRFAMYSVDREHFPRVGSIYRYAVRACEGDRCSAWSTEPEEARHAYVEIQGGDYACFEGAPRRCEAECYPGAPRRFPELPPCAGSG